MKRIYAWAVALSMSVAAMAANPEVKKPYHSGSTFYDQRVTHFETLPVGSDDIVMLGNSITNGCEWHELFGMPNIKNRGISGDVVNGVFARLDPILKGKPQKVFLMIGINDVARGEEADTVVSRFENLVKYIRQESPSTQLYVQSILPVNQSFNRFQGLNGREDVVRYINREYERIAGENGCTWIDLYSLLTNEQGNLDNRYTNDGLHLLGEGYLVWRDALLPYIKK